MYSCTLFIEVMIPISDGHLYDIRLHVMNDSGYLLVLLRQSLQHIFSSELR